MPNLAIEGFKQSTFCIQIILAMIVRQNEGRLAYGLECFLVAN